MTGSSQKLFEFLEEETDWGIQIMRHHLMGEVRFIWPDLTSPKAQIQFSSLVEGMALRDMVAIVRWVLKDQAEPTIGLCVPEMDHPGDDRRLDYMFWVKVGHQLNLSKPADVGGIQLPFAEDEHNFWFPSLTNYKTRDGRVITEHPLLPTEEQCGLMDGLVQTMDLDGYAARLAKKHKTTRNAEDEGMDGEEE